MHGTIWKQDGLELVFEEPSVYVDHQSKGRSGHMSHAMVEFRKNCLLDFNSNCSKYIKPYEGHMPFGFIEMRKSFDTGETFGEIKVLPYSMTALLDGEYTISVEKAVAVGTRIIAFCLRNTSRGCEPWLTPTWITSDDEGETWSDPRELCEFAGRVYDADVHDGKVYVLMNCNEYFLGTSHEPVFRIYVSDDVGESFSLLNTVPIDSLGRGYGTLVFRQDGSMLVFAYNSNDECHMDYALSIDLGRSFTEIGTVYVDKKIRNPQITLLDDVYVLHGRAGKRGFVFYTSRDCINWSEGILFEPDRGGCYYSNSIQLEAPNGGKRLLVQFSESYEGARVNIMHMWIHKG